MNDTTSARIPPLDELQTALHSARQQLARIGPSAESEHALRWLAVQLPALLADKARMDLLDEYFEDVHWQGWNNGVELEWFVGDGSGEPNLRTFGATIRAACDRALEVFDAALDKPSESPRPAEDATTSQNSHASPSTVTVSDHEGNR